MVDCGGLYFVYESVFKLIVCNILSKVKQLVSIVNTCVCVGVHYNSWLKFKETLQTT